jgi:hypothetical protein
MEALRLRPSLWRFAEHLREPIGQALTEVEALCHQRKVARMRRVFRQMLDSIDDRASAKVPQRAA